MTTAIQETVAPQPDYEMFLRAKRAVATPAGFEIAEHCLNRSLFPFQRHIVWWALKRGRAAEPLEMAGAA